MSANALCARLRLHRGSAQVDRRDHDVRIEAKFDRAEVPQGAAEEHRADHQHHREGDLGDDQSAPERDRLVAIGRRSARAATVVAGSRRVAVSAGLRPNNMQVRTADAATNANTRQSGAEIHEDSGAACVEERHEHLADPPRQQQPAKRAECGDERALGQQLPDNAAT